MLYFEYYKVFDINNLKDIKLNKFTLVRYRIPNPKLDNKSESNWCFVQSKFWLKHDEGLLKEVTDKVLVFDKFIVDIEDFKIAHQFLPWVEQDLLKIERWLEAKSKLV